MPACGPGRPGPLVVKLVAHAGNHSLILRPVAFAAWNEAQLATLCAQICAGVATAQTVLDGLKAKRELSTSPHVQAARLTSRRAKRCHCPQVSPPDRAERPSRLL